MRALVWTGPRQMEMQDAHVPEPGPGEVVVKVAHAAICGSELSGYLGHNALRTPPLIMGHEFAGTISEVGEGVDIETSGTVVVNPLSATGTSRVQQLGLDQLASTRSLLGAHRPGAYAEYVAVPAGSVHQLPEGVDSARGSLVEPAACGLRIGKLAGDVDREVCFIAGAGPIGLFALQALVLRGATVYVSDLQPGRRAMAEALGGIAIDPSEGDLVQTLHAEVGADSIVVAVDAVGATPTRQDVIGAVRQLGTVILSGLHEEVGPIPAADVIRREVTLRGAFAYSPEDFTEAIDLVASRALNLDGFTHHADLSEGDHWFDALVTGVNDHAKIILEP